MIRTAHSLVIHMTSCTPVSKQDHCNKVIGAQAAKVDEESDADEQLRSWIMNCSMKKGTT